MPTPSWDESLRTGNDLIDRQHSDILRLISDLPALENGPDTHVLELLDRLAEYALVHSLAEEELMVQMAYPEVLAEEMRAEHAEFTEFVRLKVLEFRSGASVDVSELHVFLDEWVTAHMRGPDALLCVWIRARVDRTS